MNCNEIYKEKIILAEPFVDFAARFAHLPGTVVLMSGGELDCARYHIIGALPWLTFSGRGRSLSISTSEGTLNYKSNPFDMLRLLLEKYKTDGPFPEIPFCSGLMGYLSYDLKDSLEKLPRTSVDDIRLPDILFYAPSIILVHDKIKDETNLFIPAGNCNACEARDAFGEILKQKPAEAGNNIYAGGFKSGFDKEAYLEAVNKIREYIKAGDVYQVNMSQRFTAEFSGDSFDLFRIFYRKNPAPFFSFINAGDHQIISTSPERFIHQKERRVETRPIKGTRPRGSTDAEDEKLQIDLLKSGKDDAELSMIVDLIRNDLGKVCKAGSVKVVEHKRIESYRNVYHLVSIVEGVLDDGLDSADLIRAIFPGGSITGCPKIRAMEIIDELEPCRRHIYTGSIGYIGFHDTMDLSIAIRTATVYNGRIIYSVGGGIVFDSNPEDEYDETLHKGRTIMETFGKEEERPGKKSFIWHNGVIKPAESAYIPADSEGFLYGYGFFETIRVSKGKPELLCEHIGRFENAWKHLFKDDPPDLTWEDIINQVIRENGLNNETAALKIIAAKGNGKTLFNNELLVTARSYTHRLNGGIERGLALAAYPEPRQTPLADYKTLNYLYYLLAGRWAKENNADEALILNPDGSISETNTANILVIKGRRVIKPVSPHALPGIMEEAVCALLLGMEYSVEKRKIYPEEMLSADGIILTNSLMGAVPALRFDKKELADSSELCIKINRELHFLAGIHV
ncbi:MAG: aminodeoxychorismate synthase, component I [Desulfobacteraceae bacterium A6]|nr:MAG: aminodeoxychorismate synthase, component I [Desulfobacteraceae bacterium A6]